jgi:hypothetical protein
MQYGSPQLFSAIRDDLARDPARSFVISPTWANNPNIFVSFFLTDQQARQVRFSSIDGFLIARQPMAEDQVFVLPPDEYERARASNKLVAEAPDRVIAYPDGSPGFYFVRLRYVDNADAIFAADRLARQQLRSASVSVDGQDVTVRYSLPDSGRVVDLFDGDAHTLLRGLEANPFILELSFPSPRRVAALGLDFATMQFSLKVEITPADGGAARSFVHEYRDLPMDPHIDLPLPDGPQDVSKLRLEIKDLNAGENAHIHIREVALQ